MGFGQAVMRNPNEAPYEEDLFFKKILIEKILIQKMCSFQGIIAVLHRFEFFLIVNNTMINEIAPYSVYFGDLIRAIYIFSNYLSIRINREAAKTM